MSKVTLKAVGMKICYQNKFYSKNMIETVHITYIIYPSSASTSVRPTIPSHSTMILASIHSREHPLGPQSPVQLSTWGLVRKPDAFESCI